MTQYICNYWYNYERVAKSKIYYCPFTADVIVEHMACYKDLPISEYMIICSCTVEQY